MAITYPLTTVLSAVGFADQVFQLTSRQEQSRLASGITRGKDFGPAIWVATYTTGNVANDDALAYEAMLNSLDGVIQTFEASDLRRQYPRLDPLGATYSDGVLHSVNANNKALSLSGLIAGQVVSVGDYLSFDYTTGRALHQVMETVTANGSGVTAEFEVRPFIRTGWSLSATVKLKVPRGIFVMLPGSVSSKISNALYSVISFQAIQSLS
jgi:hypothetical protein